MKQLFYCLGLFLLTSCTSIPLSSMLKMVSLDSDDIMAINPSELRVRLSITDPVELQTKNVRLALQFDYADGSHSEYEYLLRILDVSVLDPFSSWFSSEPLKHAYQFKLAKLSQLEFEKYKKIHISKGKPKKYQWRVYYYLKKAPTEGKAMKIDMELKLSEVDDYFYLLKDAPLNVD